MQARHRFVYSLREAKASLFLCEDITLEIQVSIPITIVI